MTDEKTKPKTTPIPATAEPEELEAGRFRVNDTCEYVDYRLIKAVEFNGVKYPFVRLPREDMNKTIRARQSASLIGMQSDAMAIAYFYWLAVGTFTDALGGGNELPKAANSFEFLARQIENFDYNGLQGAEAMLAVKRENLFRGPDSS